MLVCCSESDRNFVALIYQFPSRLAVPQGREDLDHASARIPAHGQESDVREGDIHLLRSHELAKAAERIPPGI